MIPEYKYIKDFLTKQCGSTAEPNLKFMMEKVLSKVETYLNKAIKCKALVLATVLNPFHWLSIFQLWFPNHYWSTE
jgi:hypothetical protein